MMPPGRVMRPDRTSLTAAMPPTSSAPSPKVAFTSGSITRKLWFSQWKTPWPPLSPVRMKDALPLTPAPPSWWWAWACSLSAVTAWPAPGAAPGVGMSAKVMGPPVGGINTAYCSRCQPGRGS